MPSLQCPDCATRHPLGEMASVETFRCRGCERLLKVPEAYRRPPSVDAGAPTRAAPRVAPAPARPPDEPAPAAAGSVSVAPTPDAPAPDRARALALAPVPWPLRLAVWLVAVPTGFAVVVAVTRALGILDRAYLTDIVLGSTGWDRFLPVARMVPFVALVAALVAHFGILGLQRWRGRRRRAQPRAEPVASDSGP